MIKWHGVQQRKQIKCQVYNGKKENKKKNKSEYRYLTNGKMYYSLYMNDIKMKRNSNLIIYEHMHCKRDVIVPTAELLQ